MDLIQKAREFATAAHHKQTRRDGVTPYITHPTAVAARLAADDDLPDEIREPALVVAWLHDVLEDTPVTANDLMEAGFPADVVTAVVAITKLPGEEYEDYLERVVENNVALVVKMADIMTNLEDAPTDKQKAKYFHAVTYFKYMVAKRQRNAP